MRGGGRKKLKQEALNGDFDIKPGYAFRRVVSLRGSNVVEVEDELNVRSLCLLPARFNKVLWIRKGGFVVVDEGEREKVLEAGNKVTGLICQVLFEEQIRALKRSLIWPLSFQDTKATHGALKECITGKQTIEKPSSHDGSFSEEDDDLPPLESNQNRWRMHLDVEESGSDEED